MKMPDFMSNVLGRTSAPPAATTSNPTPAANSAPSPLPTVENRSPAKTTAPKPAATPVLPAIGDGDETATATLEPSLPVADRLRALKSGRQSELEILELEAEETRAALREFNRKQREENARREAQEHDRRAAAQAEVLRRQEEERTRPRTWEERFADSSYKGEAVLLTKHFLETLIATAGLEEFLARKAAEIAPFDTAWTEAEAKLATAREEIVRQAARKILAANFEAATKNELNKIQAMPDPGKVDAQFTAERIVLREIMRTQNSLARPLLNEIANALQDSARALAVKRDADERGFANLLNAEFQPSHALKSLVATGFRLAQELTNIHSTARPFDYLCGILQKRVPAQSAKT